MRNMSKRALARASGMGSKRALARASEMGSKRALARASIAVVTVALLAWLCSAETRADDKPARPPAAAANPPQSPDACAEARASARYVGLGYTHVVTLRNGCPKSVECALWTDVDPEPRTTVRARPGESVELVTRRGSPAREVSAFKACTFK